MADTLPDGTDVNSQFGPDGWEAKSPSYPSQFADGWEAAVLVMDDFSISANKTEVGVSEDVTITGEATDSEGDTVSQVRYTVELRDSAGNVVSTDSGLTEDDGSYSGVVSPDGEGTFTALTVNNEIGHQFGPDGWEPQGAQFGSQFGPDGWEPQDVQFDNQFAEGWENQ